MNFTRKYAPLISAAALAGAATAAQAQAQSQGGVVIVDGGQVNTVTATFTGGSVLSHAGVGQGNHIVGSNDTFNGNINIGPVQLPSIGGQALLNNTRADNVVAVGVAGSIIDQSGVGGYNNIASSKTVGQAFVNLSGYTGGTTLGTAVVAKSITSDVNATGVAGSVLSGSGFGVGNNIDLTNPFFSNNYRVTSSPVAAVGVVALSDGTSRNLAGTGAVATVAVGSGSGSANNVATRDAVVQDKIVAPAAPAPQ